MSAGTQPMLRLLGLLPQATRADMVAMYRDSLRTELRALAGVLDGDLEPCPALRTRIHTLAGSAAMMQDSDLSGPARSIEKLLIAGELSQARALWPAFEQAARQTLAALEAV